MVRFKYLSKVICILIVMLLTVSSVIGCGKKDDDVVVPTKKEEEVIVDTGKYIVKDNVANYSILIPENPDYNINLCVDEFNNAFEYSCGEKLPVTSTYTAGNKYISIGNTSLYNQNKVAICSSDLVFSEIRVKTLNENVFINGCSTEDTVYATYEFLERTIGFKVYTLDDIYIQKLNSIKLYDIDLREKPDISIRSLRYGRIYQDTDTYTERLNHRRMRAIYNNDTWFTSGHNMVEKILPKSMYLKDHPEWYSKPVQTTSDYVDGGQLCLSNEEVVAEFIKRTKEIIQNDTDFDSKKLFMIGMGDNWDCCKCVNCKKMAEENGGTDSNRACNEIIFANKVEKAINDDWDWLKENHPDTQVQFVFYGYFFNATAPVTYNVNGDAIPNSPNCVCDEHVSVLYAALGSDYKYAINDTRSRIYKNFKGWGAVCQNVMYYGYCVEFAELPVPYIDLATLDGNVKAIVDNGGLYYQDQGATLTNTAGMDELGWYVRSNIMWDASRCVKDYAHEFIDYYYMPVAEKFKKYYDTFSAFQIYQIEELEIPAAAQDSSYIKEEYWPKDWLDTFNDMLDDMINDLEPYKTSDPAMYKKYFDRVNKEKIWVYYLYCDNYKRYFNEADYNELVEFVRKYSAEYGVSEYREYTSITEKINGWL